MQPYEFGYRVGYAMEKRALLGEIGDQIAFGSGGVAGQFDPTQRGLVQDLALYSNPITGVPTAVNDVGRHLYNGRWTDAGMSALSGALSFLPGFGFAARGAGRAAVGAGKAIARAGAPQVGNAIARGSAKFVNQGRNFVAGANQAMSTGVQKALPLAKNPGMAGKVYNAAIRNPMQAMQTAPLVPAVGSLGAAMLGGGGGANMQQQQFQQPMAASPGAFGGGAANRPLASF
jgi:hypothetical protein